MTNNLSLSEVLTWSSPLTYFFMLILFIALLSIRAIMNVNQIMRENGMQLSLFGNYYSDCLKWTSKHETKTGILMLLIVLLGIICAVKF